MKKIFFFFSILISLNGICQSNLYYRGDTSHFLKGNNPNQLTGNHEVNIFNSTRTRTGAFLQNYNNGRTRFAYAVDSVWKIDDTLFIRRGDSTYEITIAAGVNNIYNTNGTLTGNRTLTLDDKLFTISRSSGGVSTSFLNWLDRIYSEYSYSDGTSFWKQTSNRMLWELDAPSSIGGGGSVIDFNHSLIKKPYALYRTESASFRQDIYLDSSGLYLKPYQGALKIDSLNQGVGTKALRYDPATQLVTVADTTEGGGGTWGSITGTLSDQTDLQAELNAKEASFSETAEEFTSSTSMSITLSNTPKSGKAEMYYLNGIVIKSSNISRTGTSVTLSGFTRESSDVITAKYSY